MQTNSIGCQVFELKCPTILRMSDFHNLRTQNREFVGQSLSTDHGATNRSRKELTQAWPICHARAWGGRGVMVS
jgi:hypothetical protein